MCLVKAVKLIAEQIDADAKCLDGADESEVTALLSGYSLALRAAVEAVTVRFKSKELLEPPVCDGMPDSLTFTFDDGSKEAVTLASATEVKTP